MFSLIIEYQRPRIMYYVDKLREALLSDQRSAKRSEHSPTELSQRHLASIRPFRDRQWTDHEGNIFEIPTASACKSGPWSEAAITGDSLLNIEDDIGSVLVKIQEFCGFSLAPRFTPSQISLMRSIMSASLRIWRSIRHESAIKAAIRNRLWDLRGAAKREKTFVIALKYLGRTCLAVETFVEAAERMPMFQAIRCEAIHPPRKKTVALPVRQDPLQMLASLRVEVRDKEWIQYLQKDKAQRDFQDMRSRQRFLHAELQVLNHFASVLTAGDKSIRVHPYIGCSKLCCLLCFRLVLAHGKFKMRGTHLTVMYRWEVPSAVGLQPAANRLYKEILTELRATLGGSFRNRNSIALAQSSAAMSTAKTVSDQDIGQMEFIELNRR